MPVSGKAKRDDLPAIVDVMAVWSTAHGLADLLMNGRMKSIHRARTLFHRARRWRRSSSASCANTRPHPVWPDAVFLSRPAKARRRPPSPGSGRTLTVPTASLEYVDQCVGSLRRPRACPDSPSRPRFRLDRKARRPCRARPSGRPSGPPRRSASTSTGRCSSSRRKASDSEPMVEVFQAVADPRALHLVDMPVGACSGHHGANQHQREGILALGRLGGLEHRVARRGQQFRLRLRRHFRLWPA